MPDYRKFRDILIEQFREEPESAQAYLEESIKEYENDGDAELLLLALRTVAEAQGGVPKLAKSIGMQRQSLYKALSENGNPRLSTIGAVLQGLGYRLTIQPITS